MSNTAITNCSRCGGTGKVYDARTASTTPITCPRCRGVGFTISLPLTPRTTKEGEK